MGKIINISKTTKPGVMVRLPEDLFAKYKGAAESVGNTLPAWIRMACASYYRSWRDTDGKKARANTDDRKIQQVIAEFDTKQEERARETALRDIQATAQADFDKLSTTEKAKLAYEEAMEENELEPVSESK